MLSFIKVEVGNRRSMGQGRGQAFLQALMGQHSLTMNCNVCARRMGLENLKTKTRRPGNTGKR